LNYRKKGLNRLLELILHKRMRRLVLTHKDRLLRFGSELIFAICEIQNIEIVIKGEPPSFEEELAQDVIEIIIVFSVIPHTACAAPAGNQLPGLLPGAQSLDAHAQHFRYFPYLYKGHNSREQKRSSEFCQQQLPLHYPGNGDSSWLMEIRRLDF
jgi:hypothetical protein